MNDNSRLRSIGKGVGMALVIVILVATIVLIFPQSWQHQFRTLATLRQVDDYPLYVMHYTADYELTFLHDRTQAKSEPQSESSWACTCFAASTPDGDWVFGRNFDWHNRPTLVLFTHPSDAYASVSMVDIAYLGFTGDERLTWINRWRLLDAPRWPFDGMNEMGLAVGMMAVPYAQDSQDARKTPIGSLSVIRLLLDYARDVTEAVSLLEGYRVDFGGGPPVHYLIADAAGRSVVVEFVDGETRIVSSKEGWQVSTNFVISDNVPQGAHSACWRYNLVYETLENAAGKVSPQDALALLEQTSQQNTMWSAVYNMTSGDILVAVGKQYDRVKSFKLAR